MLVEGESDRLALEEAAAVCGLDLAGSPVSIVAMGGATNVARFARALGDEGAVVVGLCDAGEEHLFLKAGVLRTFVCHRDLEDELIRALGLARVEAVIEREGELASLRTLQQMPFHRGRSAEEHLHRFIGTRSGRKLRYASLLTGELVAGELPEPLRDLLAFAGAAAAGEARSAPPPRPA